MDQWKDYFHHPSPSILGLITASMSIGSMLAIPFVPYAGKRSPQQKKTKSPDPFMYID